MKKNVLFFCLSLLLTPFANSAQTFESILETFEDDEISELQEVLRTLVPSPFRINHAPADSLETLWFLEPGQLKSLSRLQQKQAPNISYKDIIAATDLPEEIVRVLFDARGGVDFRTRIRTRMLRRSAGWQQNTRFDFEGAGVTAGGMAERDPGERQINDFMTGYVSIAPTGPRSQLIAGQFLLQSGTGLIYAGPYGSPVLTQPARAIAYTPARLRPYRSTNENLAFNGFAVSLPVSRMQWIIFYSRAKRDARVAPNGTVISRPNDGIHVTDSQIAARNALLERSFGTALNVPVSSAMNLSINLLHQQYSHTISPPDSIRQHYAFRGEARSFYSAAFQYIGFEKRMNIVGEFGFSGHAQAGLLSMQWRTPLALLTTAFWQAAPGFQNEFGALPGNRVGGTGNESAFYTGLQARIGAGRLVFFNIRHKTLWRTYTQPQPVKQQDLGIYWQQMLGPGSELWLRIKYRTQDAAWPSEASTQQPAGEQMTAETRFSWRVQFRTRLQKMVNYLIRVEAVSFALAETIERGTMQSHEIEIRKRVFRAAMRYTYFSAKSFASRMYVFEPFLPGYTLSQALFGTGEQLLLMLKWVPSRTIRVAAFTRRSAKLGAHMEQIYGLQISAGSE